MDLITIQFLMARDRELPNVFQKLNRWGVPSAGLLIATLVPMALVIAVEDMAGLADLYAVGVVGAIATNLGATCTDRKAELRRGERGLMFATFLVMAAIEISLLFEKPNARYFAFTILAVGLVMRGLVQERRSRREVKARQVLNNWRRKWKLHTTVARSCAQCVRAGAPWISHSIKPKKPGASFACSSSASSAL